MEMFCYQCEQTAMGTGCKTFGACGKDPETAALQDALVHALKGLAMYAHRARQLGVSDPEINTTTARGLFTTLTNVNFDPERISDCVTQTIKLREKARALYEKASNAASKQPETLSGPATWQPAADLAGLAQPAADLAGLAQQARALGIDVRKEALGDDIAGLQELLTYGLKGVAAYADHAAILGQEDEAVYGYIHQALDYLAKDIPVVDEILPLILKCGEANLKAMELLDAGNTGTYGHPVPTPVRVTPVKGKAIVVSGHDLKDLEELLKQTEGKGINVYTHGEMLPAHGYPELHKYKHLVGNYGGAWQEQRSEFDAFPGAILMTTNCIQKPKETYKGRIFTNGNVGWPGATHIRNRNFAPVIEAALAADGFAADEPEQTITVGFGRQAVMSVAGAVIDAVKSGAIKHFFLVGGCDGAKSGRNYYTDFAKAVPQDCVILTLACGKYRFNKLDFGTIGGIPRLLDIGQCNDAYSAIQIAVALANAFQTDVNSLPLSLVLSWYEQKAVSILLTLLALGLKNIRLGPSLPAFVTPAVLAVLVQKFDLKPISTVEQDLKEILGG